MARRSFQILAAVALALTAGGGPAVQAASPEPRPVAAAEAQASNQVSTGSAEARADNPRASSDEALEARADNPRASSDEARAASDARAERDPESEPALAVHAVPARVVPPTTPDAGSSSPAAVRPVGAVPAPPLGQRAPPGR